MYGFIHVYKSAGTTLNRMLRASYGARHFDVEPIAGVKQPIPFSEKDLRFILGLKSNVSGFAGHRVKAFAEMGAFADRINYFTIMRDPIKRASSAFQYSYRYQKKKYGKILSFEEWLEDPYTSNLHCKMISGVSSFEATVDIIEKKNIFIGNTDNYYESLVMLKRAHLKELNIIKSSFNVSSNNFLSNKAMSDKKLRSQLIETNKEDQKLFDYAKNVLYPKYITEYGLDLAGAVSNLPNVFTFDQRYSGLVNRVYRNIIYKPMLRYEKKRLLGR